MSNNMNTTDKELPKWPNTNTTDKELTKKEGIGS